MWRSPVSVRPLEGCGREFKSLHLDQKAERTGLQFISLYSGVMAVDGGGAVGISMVTVALSESNATVGAPPTLGVVGQR